MLHKGKLQAALQLKKGQFTIYDGSFSDQLQAYRHALETLHQRYSSSKQLEDILPPDGSHVPAGARPRIEFYPWLVSLDQTTPRAAPTYPLWRMFANHQQAREWAGCIESITTLARGGNQLQPWRDGPLP